MPNVTKVEPLTRAQCYSLAESRLRTAHREEFESSLAAIYAENGYEYKPRLTEEERVQIVLNARKAKAAEKVAALIAEHGADILPEQVLLPDSGSQDVVS